MIASHLQIVAAVMSLRPNAAWHLVGEEFESSQPINIEWLDETQERPSDEEVFAEVEKQSRSI
jgi:hypothetical protein